MTTQTKPSRAASIAPAVSGGLSLHACDGHLADGVAGKRGQTFLGDWVCEPTRTPVRSMSVRGSTARTHRPVVVVIHEGNRSPTGRRPCKGRGGVIAAGAAGRSLVAGPAGAVRSGAVATDRRRQAARSRQDVRRVPPGRDQGRTVSLQRQADVLRLGLDQGYYPQDCIHRRPTRICAGMSSGQSVTG